MKRKPALGALASALLLAVAVGSTTAAASVKADAPSAKAGATATTVRIWTDQDRKAAVDKVASAWGKSRGVSIEVVVKPFGDIRDNLKTVQAENAPDVIVAAHDWTGELAANGSVVQIFPSKAVKKVIPGYAMRAFSYGGKQFGLPTTLENVGLFVNTKLAGVPRTWPDLEKRALAFKRKSSGNVAIAVQQGSGGDAYHMYPFFSGLCGYVFATTSTGSLNPRKLGVANPLFLKNAPLIDRWNREGLINSKIDGGTAQEAFLKGKAAYWITGPWNIDTVRKAGIKFRIVQVPKIRCRAVPFLGVNGFMVTRFAAGHGVATAAKDLVTRYMASTSAQLDLAQANGRFPANTLAGKRVKDTALKQIGIAGNGGVAMPNIPQMASVWGDLGGAWVKSTKGAGATKARVAFVSAARAIAAKIAGG
jgi:arabinogalactan oligomer/maltooligosaccharide transport system substrate-binding protein